MIKRSKVIMAYPLLGFSGTYVKHMPLGLLYASIGLVKRNVPVELFDQRNYAGTWKKELRSMINDDVLCVGISVMSGTPIKHAREMSRYIKKLDPDVKVIWGGPHVTFSPKSALHDELCVDFVLGGFAVDSFDQMVKSLERGEIPCDVHGAGWRDSDGTIQYNGGGDKSFDYVDFRDIPYSLIKDFDEYGQLDQGKRIFSMYSAVGCPYKCAFCSSPAQYASIQGKKWVPLKAKEVVDHIQYVVDKYDANYVYFIDDDSFPKLSHVEAVIDEFVARGLNTRVKLGFRGARINEIKRMSDEFLTKLANAGTDIIHIGAESGSDRILKLIRKDCTAEDIIECNRKLARHPEITVAYNLILGVPTETIDDMRKTRDLVLQLLADHPRCIIFPPNKFRPLPSTELYDLAEQQWGYEMPASLEDWQNIENESALNDYWSSEEMRGFFNMMLITSYFIDNKISRVTKGANAFYKIARLGNFLYRPIALMRFRYGLYQMLIEQRIFNIITNVVMRHRMAD